MLKINIFFLFFFIFKLYITVLVLPNIKNFRDLKFLFPNLFLCQNFKSDIKISVTLLLGFCIFVLTNLHQRQRVYITFIDVWISGCVAVTKDGKKRKAEILTPAKIPKYYQSLQAAPVLLGMKHNMGNEVKRAWNRRGHGSNQPWDERWEKVSKDLIKAFISSVDILV